MSVKPTHILYIEVPLRIEGENSPNFDPVKDAIRNVIAISRAAYAGAICDDPMVTIRERGTICGLCGGYGAANEKTHKPVPCLACGKRSEGMVLMALDPPRDELPPKSQHLGLYLVEDDAAPTSKNQRED
jgi:hypothetical protein